MSLQTKDEIHFAFLDRYFIQHYNLSWDQLHNMPYNVLMLWRALDKKEQQKFIEKNKNGRTNN